MVSGRLCQATSEAGQPCRQPPLSEKQFCFWHEPSNAQEAAEARRLGGLRRRREQTVSGAYDLGGLASVAGIRRRSRNSGSTFFPTRRFSPRSSMRSRPRLLIQS